jgi:hypothetical protein
MLHDQMIVGSRAEDTIPSCFKRDPKPSIAVVLSIESIYESLLLSYTPHPTRLLAQHLRRPEHLLSHFLCLLNGTVLLLFARVSSLP